MTFNKVNKEFIQKLVQITAPERVLVDENTLAEYAHDKTEDLHFTPEVVVKPISTAEVSQTLKLCNDRHIPVTASGARTGLSGGMLPVHGGIVLSMEKMNHILDIDVRNLQITVESGVITQHIMDAALENGLMYPPDPSSKGSCMIGGNLAENAGGAHAVKYGITSDYVLATETVLANGDIINTGAKVLKNSTGYDLTRLMVGSEGTLGIVTKIVLKLVPKPAYEVTMLIAFSSAQRACDAVSAIFHSGITPCALEFMEKAAIDFGQKHLGIKTYDTAGVEAHLLIEVDGNNMDAMMQDCEEITKVVEKYGAHDVLFADGQQQRDELWRIRRCIGEAVKSGGNIYKEEDAVVPRAELAKLMAYVKELGEEYGFQSVCYGHAGDGNVHINILRNDLSDTQWNIELPKAIRKLFERTVNYGGTLSGEHGIGYVQRNYMDIAFSPIELQLMKSIKKVFDPNGILNPGKVFPDE